MKKKCKSRILFIFTIVAAFLSASGFFGADCRILPGTAAGLAYAAEGDFPLFELPIPETQADRAYLGLSGSGTFKVGQIKARVVIVEVFSFYCPHCQRSAAQVNDLYQLIEKRADLKNKVKVIGIGAKNSAYEVDAYRERYRVPFPLFPDEDMGITEKLGVKGTPTFIGVTVDGKGNQKRVYFGEGGFQDNQKFLTEIVRLSGL